MSVKIVKPLHSGEVVLFVLVLVVLFSIAIILLRERQTEREREGCFAIIVGLLFMWLFVFCVPSLW